MIILRFATAVGVAGLFVSCDRFEDPGIKEKVALLEAELRNRDEQLATMQEEMASKAGAEAGSPAPDIQAASGSYLGFVEGLRKKLAGVMPGVKFDRTSVFPVVGPDPAKPITSSVAFRVVGPDGRPAEITISLFADAAGQWQDPETSEIVSGFKAKQAAAPPVASNVPAPQPAPPPKTKPADVMGADRTVEVEWNDGPKPAPRTAQQPAPQQPAAQQPAAQPAPAAPSKVMPTTKPDVIIDFQ